MIKNKEIIVYADGACSGNPGPGGWGVFMQYGEVTKELYGYELNTTNNQMELRAVIEALKAIKKTDYNIKIYIDSNYVKQGITVWIHSWILNNWSNSSKKPVKNSDLWKNLYESTKKYDTINWYWVKGHSGVHGNEIADSLANKGKSIALQILSYRQLNK